MIHRTAAHLAVFAAAVAGATGAPVAAAGPGAHAAGSCRIANPYGYGYTYLTSLRVTGTSCRTGGQVAKRHGHVKGWRCASRTLARSSVQYQARVTCRSGRRTVLWVYAQNR